MSRETVVCTTSWPALRSASASSLCVEIGRRLADKLAATEMSPSARVDDAGQLREAAEQPLAVRAHARQQLVVDRVAHGNRRGAGNRVAAEGRAVVAGDEGAGRLVGD